jgi:hypothetical protein
MNPLRRIDPSLEIVYHSSMTLINHTIIRLVRFVSKIKKGLWNGFCYNSHLILVISVSKLMRWVVGEFFETKQGPRLLIQEFSKRLFESL